MYYHHELPKGRLPTVIFQAVIALCQDKHLGPSSPPETWPGTREIAEHCALDIYRTRYFLLKLANAGFIDTRPGSIHNSLRWRVSATQSPPYASGDERV